MQNHIIKSSYTIHYVEVFDFVKIMVTVKGKCTFFHLSHLLTACCDLPTNLNKHSKEELSAELLDPLGYSLSVVTVRCLFLDFFC